MAVSPAESWSESPRTAGVRAGGVDLHHGDVRRFIGPYQSSFVGVAVLGGYSDPGGPVDDVLVGDNIAVLADNHAAACAGGHIVAEDRAVGNLLGGNGHHAVFNAGHHFCQGRSPVGLHRGRRCSRGLVHHGGAAAARPEQIGQSTAPDAEHQSHRRHNSQCADLFADAAFLLFGRVGCRCSGVGHITAVLGLCITGLRGLITGITGLGRLLCLRLLCFSELRLIRSGVGSGLGRRVGRLCVGNLAAAHMIDAVLAHRLGRCLLRLIGLTG